MTMTTRSLNLPAKRKQPNPTTTTSSSKRPKTTSDDTALQNMSRPLAASYYLIVTSREHARRGVEGGFCQANHGKKAPVQRMRKGDGVVFYSGKEHFDRSKMNQVPRKTGTDNVVQRFTAVGTVSDPEVYQVNATESFHPWRRNVDFVKDCKEVDIKDLIESLHFITNKKSWGASLRFGFLKIGKEDFELIEERMRRA